MGLVEQETPDGAAYFGPKPEFESCEEKLIYCLFILWPNWSVVLYTENESSADNY